MHTSDEKAWAERILPDYDNLRAAFECAMTDGDIDRALRLVTSLPEPAHLRIGFEPGGWAQRLLDHAPAEHPLFAAAAGYAARSAWNQADHVTARALAERAGGRIPGRGTGRIAYPGDVLADVALYEGKPADALRHYDAEVSRARRDDDPIRLVWTLFYVAICHAALRNPDRGLQAAEEARTVAEATANPTARSMADYALGLVLKKSQPDRALALFDEAAELAASAQQLLVARHRADGGGVHPRGPWRPDHGGTRFHRRARPLGQGGGLEPAVAQPALRDPPAGPSRCR